MHFYAKIPVKLSLESINKRPETSQPWLMVPCVVITKLSFFQLYTEVQRITAADFG